MIIGDRKKVKPHQAHEYFWLLMELNVLPMAVWEPDGKFIAINQTVLDLIGYSKEDFERGRINWRELTPEEYRPLDEKCIKELETQHVAIPYEKEYIRKDGRKIKIRLHNASPDMGESKRGIVIFVPLN